VKAVETDLGVRGTRLIIHGMCGWKDF
jgi:hypothetical protein